MTELDCKKQFAALLLSDMANPFKAALAVFENDSANACKYALLWKDDPEVLAEIELLKATKSISDIVANKIEVAKCTWALANNDWTPPKSRVDALRLLAEMAGYMPDKTINKNVTADVKVNKVMLVKDHGENEDWEEKIRAQQKGLINAN